MVEGRGSRSQRDTGRVLLCNLPPIRPQTRDLTSFHLRIIIYKKLG